MTKQLAISIAITMFAGHHAVADPAGQQYAEVTKLVKESGIIKQLPAEPSTGNSISFLIIAKVRPYGPQLLLSSTGVLWVSLPDLRTRTMLSPGDLLRYNFSIDAVKSGIEDARKRPGLFIDERRQDDLPAGKAARSLRPFTWRAAAMLKSLKEKPVVAGVENGYELLVCRGTHDNGKHPGKAIGDKCYYGWGGKEHATSDFDLLAPQSGERLTWQTVAAKDIARKEVPSGYEPGLSLWVCRAAYQGATHPGKVWNGNCHIGFAGKEVPIATFETLVRAPE